MCMCWRICKFKSSACMRRSTCKQSKFDLTCIGRSKITKRDRTRVQREREMFQTGFDYSWFLHLLCCCSQCASKLNSTWVLYFSLLSKRLMLVVVFRQQVRFKLVWKQRTHEHIIVAIWIHCASGQRKSGKQHIYSGFSLFVWYR